MFRGKILAKFLVQRTITSGNKWRPPSMETICVTDDKEPPQCPFLERKCPEPSPCPLPPEEKKPHGRDRGFKIITLFIALPLIISLSVYELILHPHHTHKPEFVPYEYLRIRRKRFPWGDGDKSLFHNPRVNALPEGYEDVEGEHKTLNNREYEDEHDSPEKFENEKGEEEEEGDLSNE